jgi:hypothetical protein
MKLFNYSILFSVLFGFTLSAADEISLGSPVTMDVGDTWASLYQGILSPPPNANIKAYFEVSRTDDFSDVLKQTEGSSVSTSVWQKIDNLEPGSTYYARAVIMYQIGDQAEQTLKGKTFSFKTHFFGEDMPPPEFNKLTGELTWTQANFVNPFPDSAAVAYIKWMPEDDATILETTKVILLPTSNRTKVVFKAKKAVLPNQFILWRLVINKSAFENNSVESGVQSYQLPPYDAYNAENPCAGNTLAHTLRIGADMVVVCSDLNYFPGLFYDSGKSGLLKCPKQFVYNYNFQKGLTIIVPKIGLPVGPFGSGASFWRSSVDVRLWDIVPGSNEGFFGSSGNPGWQKWSAANWNPYEQNSQYWISCGTDPEGVKADKTVELIEKGINKALEKFFDYATSEKKKADIKPDVPVLP